MKCPTCGSKHPHLHPAAQFEGEVQTCVDDFHLQETPQNTPEYRAEVLRERDRRCEPLTIPTIGQWVADCDAALSAYPNDPAKRRKVLESYFAADRRALLAESETLVMAMQRAINTHTLSHNSRPRAALAAIRRHHGVEP